MNLDMLVKGLDVATIATWVMVVGTAILLYLEKAGRTKKSSRHSSKK